MWLPKKLAEWIGENLQEALGFPGKADRRAHPGTGWTLNTVYEVNTWLWMFARGKPRLGGISVENTDLKKRAVREEQVKRAVETRRHRKAAKASSK